MTANPRRTESDQHITTCLLSTDCPTCEASSNGCDYLDGTWYVLPLPLDPK